MMVNPMPSKPGRSEKRNSKGEPPVPPLNYGNMPSWFLPIAWTMLNKTARRWILSALGLVAVTTVLVVAFGHPSAEGVATVAKVVAPFFGVTAVGGGAVYAKRRPKGGTQPTEKSIDKPASGTG